MKFRRRSTKSIKEKKKDLAKRQVIFKIVYTVLV